MIIINTVLYWKTPLTSISVLHVLYMYLAITVHGYVKKKPRQDSTVKSDVHLVEKGTCHKMWREMLVMYMYM